jgi:excisionase family DNA binding protein
MNEEIKPNAIYTTAETQKLLKISNSTIKRMLKNGLLKANKVGGQYRILGKEILRIVSPEVERKAIKTYLNLKKKARQILELAHQMVLPEDLLIYQEDYNSRYRNDYNSFWRYHRISLLSRTQYGIPIRLFHRNNYYAYYSRSKYQWFSYQGTYGQDDGQLC